MYHKNILWNCDMHTCVWEVFNKSSFKNKINGRCRPTILKLYFIFCKDLVMRKDVHRGELCTIYWDWNHPCGWLYPVYIDQCMKHFNETNTACFLKDTFI